MHAALAAWETIDRNGSGFVCYNNRSHGLEVKAAPGAQYGYNVVDDNSSASS